MNKKLSFSIIAIMIMAMTIIVPSISTSPLIAQNTGDTKTNGLSFDKKDFDFGKFSIKDGPKKCIFKYKNETTEPILINHVLSSCGCTNPEWSKKPIMPGESGEIKVTFLNDQGPFPFEKSLTVYTTASTKPVILRIRGIVTQK